MNMINEFLQLIEENEKKEAEAREYYYKLLKICPEQFRGIINEIIEDEIDHSIKLMRIAEAVSHNMPTEYESILNLKKKGEINNE